MNLEIQKFIPSSDHPYHILYKYVRYGLPQIREQQDHTALFIALTIAIFYFRYAISAQMFQ